MTLLAYVVVKHVVLDLCSSRVSAKYTYQLPKARRIAVILWILGFVPMLSEAHRNPQSLPGPYSSS
jgi:hypothetical protein